MPAITPFKAGSLLVIAASALSLHSETLTSPKTAAPAMDKKALAEYLRYADGLGPTVAVTVDDPLPSIFAGFYEVRVHLEANRNQAVKTYYLTKDGQHVAAAPLFDLKQSPFTSNLQHLKEDNSPALGMADAAISIYVYSDFQCPYCREEAKVLRQGIEKKYADRVRIVFKNFPLEAMHPWSRAAAISGVCVAKQSATAFWTFHDWVFEHQSEFTATSIGDKVREFVNTQSLNETQFLTCMHDGSGANEVEKTLAEGRELAVVQTPTLFVSGRMVSGALAVEQLNQLIAFEVEHEERKSNYIEENRGR